MAQAERDFDKVRGELSDAVATIAEMKSRFLEQDARRAKAERACKRSKAEAGELRKVRSSGIIEACGASRKGIRDRLSTTEHDPNRQGSVWGTRHCGSDLRGLG